MKYIDRFKTMDDFLTSELQQLTGDRIATIEGFGLPILKKKIKTVVSIDPSTNEEVETEELQDVWSVPVGEVEKKVEHDYKIKLSYVDNSKNVLDESLYTLKSNVVQIPTIEMENTQIDVVSNWVGLTNFWFHISDISDNGLSLGNPSSVTFDNNTSLLGDRLAYNTEKQNYELKIKPDQTSIGTTQPFSVMSEISTSTGFTVPLELHGNIVLKSAGSMSSLSTIDFVPELRYTSSSSGSESYVADPSNGYNDTYVYDIYDPYGNVSSVRFNTVIDGVAVPDYGNPATSNNDNFIYRNSIFANKWSGSLASIANLGHGNDNKNVDYTLSDGETVVTVKNSDYAYVMPTSISTDEVATSTSTMTITKVKFEDFFCYIQWQKEVTITIRYHKCVKPLDVSTGDVSTGDSSTGDTSTGDSPTYAMSINPNPDDVGVDAQYTITDTVPTEFTITLPAYDGMPTTWDNMLFDWGMIKSGVVYDGEKYYENNWEAVATSNITSDGLEISFSNLSSGTEYRYDIGLHYNDSLSMQLFFTTASDSSAGDPSAGDSSTGDTSTGDSPTYAMTIDVAPDAMTAAHYTLTDTVPTEFTVTLPAYTGMPTTWDNMLFDWGMMKSAYEDGGEIYYQNDSESSVTTNSTESGFEITFSNLSSGTGYRYDMSFTYNMEPYPIKVFFTTASDSSADDPSAGDPSAGDSSAGDPSAGDSSVEPAVNHYYSLSFPSNPLTSREVHIDVSNGNVGTYDVSLMLWEGYNENAINEDSTLCVVPDYSTVTPSVTWKTYNYFNSSYTLNNDSVTLTLGDAEYPGDYNDKSCMYRWSFSCPDPDNQSNTLTTPANLDIYVNWWDMILDSNVAQDAYRDNTSVTSVKVAEGVTSIGESAFNGCSNLTKVSLPSTLGYLGLGAFLGTAITSIVIPEGCYGVSNVNSTHELGYGTFMNCTHLTSVTIPDSINKIGTKAFYGCSSLTSIELPYGCSYSSDSFPAGCTKTFRSAS